MFRLVVSTFAGIGKENISNRKQSTCREYVIKVSVIIIALFLHHTLDDER